MVSKIFDKIINLRVRLQDLPKIYLGGALEGRRKPASELFAGGKGEALVL